MNVLATREVTLANLTKLKQNIEESYNIRQKVKIGGTAITIAASALSLAGLGLSFFTSGTSLVLTGVATALHGAGGVTHAGADIVYLAVEQRDLKDAQMALDTDREMMESAKKLNDQLANLISSLEHKYPSIPSKDIKELIRLYAPPILNGLYDLHLSKDGIYGIGRAIITLTRSGSKSGSPTVWSGLSVWDKRLSIAYAIADVYYLRQGIQNINSMKGEVQAYETSGKSNSDAAQILEEMIFKLEHHRNELLAFPGQTYMYSIMYLYMFMCMYIFMYIYMYINIHVHNNYNW